MTSESNPTFGQGVVCFLCVLGFEGFCAWAENARTKDIAFAAFVLGIVAVCVMAYRRGGR